ncbi:tetratricopeptide repeat protein, partial [Halalkalibacterium halodurans]|nr:tetratricopeptide repeat protein [Halalkalibacterium halodurans]
MNFHEQGVRYMREGNYEEAAKAFNAAIEANPSDPIGFVNFGNLLGMVGELDKALVFFDKAIGLQEDCAPAYYGAGTIYYKQEKFEDGAKMF